MSLYDTRHTAGYKSSKLVQVCALLPEFHKEYPEAHITVKHVDFTKNKITLDYYYGRGLHLDDFSVDLDAFIEYLDDLIGEANKPKAFKSDQEVEDSRGTLETFIIASADFMRINTIGQKYFTQHDFYKYLHKLKALGFISMETVGNYLKKYEGRYPYD